MRRGRGPFATLRMTFFISQPGTKKAHRNRQAFVLKAKQILNQRHFYGVRAFFALCYFVLHTVVFTNGTHLQVADVNENVFASFVVFDEAKTFGFIKEFYLSGSHDGWLWNFPKLMGHRGLLP